MKKLMAFLLVLTLILVYRIAQVYYYKIEIPLEKPVRFSAVVTGEPQVYDRYQRLNVRVKERADINIFTSTERRFSHAQKLIITGTIKERVIDGKKVGYTSSFPHIEAENSRGSTLYPLFGDLREKIGNFYEKYLPPTHAALLFGIVFGGRETMPKDFDTALRNTGVMHVVAASGMNVALLAGGLLSIFTFVTKRQFAIVLSILSIVFYTALSGFAPSLVRAAIMGSIGLLAGLFGRQQFALWSVVFTGVCMLIVDPLLLSDIGFQLSFAATLGIISLPPLFPFIKTQGKQAVAATDFATTLAAQIATLPILFYYFKSVSFLSVFVNMLVLWTVPILMTLGAISVVAGLVFEPVGELILFLTIPLLTYFITIISFFGMFQFQMISLEQFPWTFVFVYYFFLVAIILHRQQKTHREKNS